MSWNRVLFRRETDREFGGGRIPMISSSLNRLFFISFCLSFSPAELHFSTVRFPGVRPARFACHVKELATEARYDLCFFTAALNVRAGIVAVDSRIIRVGTTRTRRCRKLCLNWSICILRINRSTAKTPSW